LAHPPFTPAHAVPVATTVPLLTLLKPAIGGKPPLPKLCDGVGPETSEA